MNFWENRKVFTVLYDNKIKGIYEKEADVSYVF